MSIYKAHASIGAQAAEAVLETRLDDTVCGICTEREATEPYPPTHESRGMNKENLYCAPCAKMIRDAIREYHLEWVQK